MSVYEITPPVRLLLNKLYLSALTLMSFLNVID